MSYGQLSWLNLLKPGVKNEDVVGAAPTGFVAAILCSIFYKINISAYLEWCLIKSTKNHHKDNNRILKEYITLCIKHSCHRDGQWSGKTFLNRAQ